eukprot:1057110-Pyramimonas_sp.AAC.1
MVQLQEPPPAEGPEGGLTKEESPETLLSSTQPSRVLPGIARAEPKVPSNVGIGSAPGERGELHASPAPGRGPDSRWRAAATDGGTGAAASAARAEPHSGP